MSFKKTLSSFVNYFSNRAFTLVEMMAAVMIVGALTVLTVPTLTPRIIDAQKKDACNNLLAISGAQQVYMENDANHNYYQSGSCDSYANASADNQLINTHLKTNISPTGSTRFCCAANNYCKAFGNNNAFTLDYSQCGIGVKCKCPDPSTVACGDAIIDNCGGTSCPTGSYCSGGKTCTASGCISPCTSKTEATACGNAIFPASPSSATPVSISCPGTCTGGPLTATCTNGTWSGVSGTCSAPPNSCAAFNSSTPCGNASFPITASGSPATVSCPGSCTGGPLTATCTNGTWSGVSGSCTAPPSSCDAFDTPTPCGNASFATSVNGSTPSVNCPGSCTGGPLTATCTNGTWSGVSGTCTAPPNSCATFDSPTVCGNATFPTSTSGSNVSVNCPGTCTGGPLTSTCTNGTWSAVGGSACIACVPDCTGKCNGESDGCGSTCGCGAGQICSAGTCIGCTCPDPSTVTCGQTYNDSCGVACGTGNKCLDVTESCNGTICTKLPVNGQCDLSALEKCKTGTVISKADSKSTNERTWVCSGSNGGNPSPTCKFSICSTSISTGPSACMVGTYATGPADTATLRKWNCTKAFTDNSTATCTKDKDDGECNVAYRKCTSSKPADPSSFDTSDPVYTKWTCPGKTPSDNPAYCKMEKFIPSCGATKNTCTCKQNGKTVTCPTGTVVNTESSSSPLKDTATDYIWRCVSTNDGGEGKTVGSPTGYCDIGIGVCPTDQSVVANNSLLGTCAAGGGTGGPIVQTAANNLWDCTGNYANGTVAHCSVAKINGACNNAKLNTCSKGTPVLPSSDANFAYWYCDGLLNGNRSVQCKIGKENGECGTAYYTCKHGTAAEGDVKQDTYSYWKCKGINGGTDAPEPCKAVRIDGGWTNWTNNCSCTVQNKTRTCTNPKPLNGGKDCSKLDGGKDSMQCNITYTQVNTTVTVQHWDGSDENESGTISVCNYQDAKITNNNKMNIQSNSNTQIKFGLKNGLPNCCDPNGKKKCQCANESGNLNYTKVTVTN